MPPVCTHNFIIPLSMASGRSRNVRLINSIVNVLYQLPEETKKVIRRIEKISYKANSCELAVTFNQTCIKENILPQ